MLPVIKRIVILLFVLIYLPNCFAYTLENLVPVSKNKLEIIRHNYYILGYNEEYEQAAWTLHRLDYKMIEGKAKRGNKFYPDNLVSTASANDLDYKKSGYDRGHLIPAADMKWNQEALNETFYYSNMSPQNQDFNRGIWQDLEEQVRNWAEQEKELFVFTGAILKPGLKTIGANSVAIPEQFYKIVVKLDNKNSKVVAFLISNRGTDQPINKFAVPVDKIEQLTGIDFLNILPDNLENSLEKSVNLANWNLAKQSKPKNTKEKLKSQIKTGKSIKKMQKNLRKLLNGL